MKLAAITTIMTDGSRHDGDIYLQMGNYLGVVLAPLLLWGNLVVPFVIRRFRIRALEPFGKHLVRQGFSFLLLFDLCPLESSNRLRQHTQLSGDARRATATAVGVARETNNEFGFGTGTGQSVGVSQ